MTTPRRRWQGAILALGGLAILVLTVIDFATDWRSFSAFFFYRPRPSLTDGVAGLALSICLTSAGLALLAGGGRTLRITHLAMAYAFFAFLTYLLQAVSERGQEGTLFVWLGVTAGILGYLRAYRLVLEGGRTAVDRGLLGGTGLALKALAAALALVLVVLAVPALGLERDLFDSVPAAVMLFLGSLPLWVLALSLVAQRVTRPG